MNDILSTQSNFRSLSIRDLLSARDQYHYHLMNKANVVGTAIGLYLIRKGDPTPEKEREMRRAGQQVTKDNSERRFDNSEVREYSWPCVLALVSKWVMESDFGPGRAGLHPEQMVPKTLYLPDGRMVPVCVVKVEQGEPDVSRVPDWHWPAGLFGGGMPIVVETQEQEHRATAGCLVSDGHTVYALTSRHVCGASAEPVYTIARGERVRIGQASKRHLTRMEFDRVYPEFPSRRTYVNLDVGLIELDDINDWTSAPYGLGDVGALADLNELNITTRLIDAPVVAHGAASGRLEGRIKALFYRYKSVGGFDYVSDFLIAPRVSPSDGDAPRVMPPQTQPGDSGAVWHLVTRQKKTREDDDWTEDDDFDGVLRPIALEWGGQVFLNGGTDPSSFAFALATSLTTVCRTLDVELVLEHNAGVLPYWGRVGHYSIAAFACKALQSGKLASLMTANIENVSFPIGLSAKEIAKRLKEAGETEGFVPLADVPDEVWKKFEGTVTGGRDDRFVGNGRTTGPEHPTHYADIDEPRASDGRTLRELSLADPVNNLTVDFWKDFYDEAHHTEQRERGLLPFRIWQFFDALRTLANDKSPTEFVCAAGLLAHYVGDACQPLHGSMFADGFADQPLEVLHHHEDGTPFTENTHVGAGVHSTYETAMVDRKAKLIVEGLQAAMATAGSPLRPIADGHDAALAIIELMDRVATAIEPRTLVQTYVDAGGKKVVAVQDALWDAFGDQTIAVMADGVRVLAHIWQSAWDAGNGNAISGSALRIEDPADLIGLYTDQAFVESVDLDHIDAILAAGTGGLPAPSTR